MYRWISWRNGRMAILFIIFLLGSQSTVIALTSAPPNPIQVPQPTDEPPTPTETPRPERGNVVTVPFRRPITTSPLTSLSVTDAPPGWFSNRDCATDLKIMPLGNSITAGRGSGPLGNENTNAYLTGYRYPLDTLLNDDKYNFDFVGSRDDGVISGFSFDFDNQGQPGQRIDELNLFVTTYLTNNPPDLIMLHIGTNDVSQDNSPSVENLKTLLDTIDTYDADLPVVIARIINEEEGYPESVHKTFFTNYNLNLQAAVDIRIGNGDKLFVVDMEPVLDYSSGSADFYDRLHPNVTGYSKMADVWFDGLKTVWPTCIPEITSTAPITAVVDQLYIYDVNATADPTATYAISGTIPAGMSIVTDTGIIIWTPTMTQTGSIPIEVAASNIAGVDLQQFMIQVNKGPTIISLAPITAVVDSLYNYQIVSSGSTPLTFSFTTTTHTPPSGMSMNESGLISWTPTMTQTGSHTVEVQVVNDFGSDTELFTIDVFEGATITSTAPTTAVVDSLYNYQLVASGDKPLTFSFTTTTYTQPTGMSIDGSGLISWTPTMTQTGLHTIEVQANNAYGVDTQQFTVQVGQTPEISSSPITTAVQGFAYTYNVIASGIPNVTFTLTQAPTGMTIDENSGVIVWNVPANYPVGFENVTVQVSNVIGIDQQPFVIDVRQGYSISLPMIVK